MTDILCFRSKYHNEKLAEAIMNHEAKLVLYSPKTQAIQDFNKGLSEDSNPFPKNSEEFKEYERVYFDCYLIQLYAEQEDTWTYPD